MTTHGKEIKFDTKHYPGYGSSESWLLRVINMTDNKVIIRKERIPSEYDLGVHVTKIKHILNDISLEEFTELCEKGKQAWTPCTGCGGNTLDYYCSVAGAPFCKTCKYNGTMQSYSDSKKKQDEEYQRTWLEGVREKEREETEYANKIRRTSIRKFGSLFCVKGDNSIEFYSIRDSMAFQSKESDNLWVSRSYLELSLTKEDLSFFLGEIEK